MSHVVDLYRRERACRARHGIWHVAGGTMIRYRGALPVLIMTSGLIVWASCFVVLYAALSLGCTYGPPAMSIMGVAGLTWILCFLWIVHLLVLGWLIAY